MASDTDFVNFVAEQAQDAGEIRTRKMFGDWALYCDEKNIVLICDNEVFLKQTPGLGELLKDTPMQPPYPGAKPAYVITSILEDSDFFTQVLTLATREFPAPKPRRKKTV